MRNVVVIGMGYVGLPLLLALVRAQKKVFGYDNNISIINNLIKGECHINLWQERFKKEILPGKNAYFVSDLSKIDTIEAAIICVPTPLKNSGKPDHSFVDKAFRSLNKLIAPPNLIILESTVSPGYTREVAEKYFKAKLYCNGGEVHICFSPEREDPGNETFSNVEIPKVISGLTSECLKMGAELYMSVFNHVVKASSLEVAELCKLHENTFRAVNISYANQMRDYSAHLGLNFDEVISLAKSKPFGFMAFNSGIGVGGHCIPIDPHFLLSKANTPDIHMSIIKMALLEIEKGPKKSYDWLIKQGVAYNDVLLTGIAYKDGVSDTRGSPAIELFKLLKTKSNVYYWDPKVKAVNILGETFFSVTEKFFKNFGGIVIIINETGERFIKDNKILASKILDPRYKIEL